MLRWARANRLLTFAILFVALQIAVAVLAPVLGMKDRWKSNGAAIPSFGVTEGCMSTSRLGKGAGCSTLRAWR
jgi:hypothetical protein